MGPYLYHFSIYGAVEGRSKHVRVRPFSGMVILRLGDTPWLRRSSYSSTRDTSWGSCNYVLYSYKPSHWTNFKESIGVRRSLQSRWLPVWWSTFAETENKNTEKLPTWCSFTNNNWFQMASNYKYVCVLNKNFWLTIKKLQFPIGHLVIQNVTGNQL